jgi:hypothetical protein
VNTFTARYSGRCHLCETGISEGDQVSWDDDRVVHEECLGRVAVSRERRESVCPTCRLATARLVRGMCPDCAAESR